MKVLRHLGDHWFMSQGNVETGRASSTAQAPEGAKLFRRVLLILTSAEQGEDSADLSEFSLRGKNNYFLIHSDNQTKRALSPFRFDCLLTNAADLLTAV